MGIKIGTISTTVNGSSGFVVKIDERLTQGAAIDADDITADGNGDKIVAAGTLLARQSGGNWKPTTDGVCAYVTLAGTGSDNVVVVTAKNSGTFGNGLTAQVAVTGSVVAVTFNGTALLINCPAETTANALIAALNLNPIFNELFVASGPTSGSDGTGTITADGPTALAGGTAGVRSDWTGDGAKYAVSESELDVTDVDGVVSCVTRGTIKSSRLTTEPGDELKALVREFGLYYID